jgi:hypothetical protein
MSDAARPRNASVISVTDVSIIRFLSSNVMVIYVHMAFKNPHG